MRKILCLLGALLAAPAAAVDVDRQLWVQTIAEVDLSPKTFAFAGLYLRYTDDWTRLGTRYALGGIGLRLSDDVELGLGYANLRNRDGDGFEYENRLFQQLSYPVVEGRHAGIDARTRLEQRFFTGGGGSKLRLRQRMEVLVPLGGEKAPSFKTSGELFITLIGTDRVDDTEFDQFRGFVGLEVPAGPLTFDIGYQGQRRVNPDRRNDVLFIGMDVSF